MDAGVEHYTAARHTGTIGRASYDPAKQGESRVRSLAPLTTLRFPVER
jgi:hypothetical protein